MEGTQLEAGLRSLRNSLAEIKAFLAWEQLKQAETRPGTPPAFRICDPTENELRNEYSLFLSTSVQMHSILKDDSLTISETKRQDINRQLTTIERQFHGLNLHQRFWNY
jgi:hypothetical protein